eukprot:scaffold16888_cov121-Isochrysis_galbana.AAC.2
MGLAALGPPGTWRDRQLISGEHQRATGVGSGSRGGVTVKDNFRSCRGQGRRASATHAPAGINRAPMPRAANLLAPAHTPLRAAVGGPAAASSRPQSRGQPLPHLKIPPPLPPRAAPPGQGEPPPRASRNKSRAHAANLLAPARPAPRCG